MFDVLIRGARVVDGTGAGGFEGTVAIRDGKIAATATGAELESALAGEVVDAQGLVLAPGFIDLHSHADFSVQGAPQAHTQLAQGVTTIVTGNCGASTFPTRDLDALQRASAQFDAVFNGVWHDASGFRSATDQHRPGVNLVLQVGHSTLRAHVVGMGDRRASDEELEAMVREIHKAADNGVRGFTSGLVYAPGTFADAREMEVLVTAASSAGMLYSTHLRNESNSLLVAIDEAISTAHAAGARLEISHLKAMGPANHGLPLRALEMIEHAASRGLDVAADAYPYSASSTTLTSRLPAPALDGGLEALMARLDEPGARAGIASGLAARFGRDLHPDAVVVAATGPAHGEEDLSWTAGMSLIDIAEKLGTSAQEGALRLLHAHRGAVAIIDHAMSDEDVTAVLQHPLVSVASDGWTLAVNGLGRPHPRSFGTFARVLGKYVRERGVLSLEEAVRKMTSLPASRIGISDRGVIAAGKVADLVLLDPDTVTDTATFTDPRQLARGVHDVWIAGNRAVRERQIQPQRYGVVL